LFHIHGLLFCESVFYAVGGHQIQGNGMSGVFTGITAEFTEKCPLVSVHASESQIKSNINDFAVLVPQPQGGPGQFVTPDVVSRRKTGQLPEQPGRIPGRKMGGLR